MNHRPPPPPPPPAPPRTGCQREREKEGRGTDTERDQDGREERKSVRQTHGENSETLIMLLFPEYKSIHTKVSEISCIARH